MSPGKHDPASLQSYFNAHQGHMRSLTDAGIVIHDGLAIEAYPSFYIMEGEIEVSGGIVVQVRKQIDVVGNTANHPRIQTTRYSYNVILPGVGTIFRYDSPHDHRPQHHVHRYAVFDRDVEGKTEILDVEQVPTLAEVIREAHAWYEKHRYLWEN